MLKNLLVCSLLLLNTPSFSQEKITLAIGQPPGGAHDIASRVLAKHLVKYLPNTTIVVENHPGADSLTVLRKLDTIFPKDGIYIVNFNSGLLIDSYLENKHSLNFTNYYWLGSTSKNNNVCLVSKDSPIKSFTDLINYKDKIYFGTVTERDSIWMYERILQKFVQDSKIVVGFKNPAEAMLALQRGEITVACGQWGPSTISFVEKNLLIPIVSFSTKKLSNSTDNITYINNLILDKEQKKLLNFFVTMSDLYRPYIMSKDTPKEVVSRVREAFNSLVIDKDFIEDSEKTYINIEPINYNEVETIFHELSKLNSVDLINYVK